MRISHKVDYGVRLMTTLAEAQSEGPDRATTSAMIAATDHVPKGFLTDILRQLRAGGLLKSHRGGAGGWLLARPAETITVADVIRSLDGPLASVRGIRPHELVEDGQREPFVSLWIAVRAALRSVLEAVTIADLAVGELPASITYLIDDPDAWETRST